MKNLRFNWKDGRVTYLWPDFPIVLAGGGPLRTAIDCLENKFPKDMAAQKITQQFKVGFSEASKYVEDIYETLNASVMNGNGKESNSPEEQSFESSKCLSMATFNITRKCNLRCVHCYANGSNNEKEELSESEIHSAIIKISHLITQPPRLLIISGGEPTLVPNKLKTAVLAAREGGLTPRLNTNGILIDEELAKFLSDHDVLVQVSIDGADPETHAVLRGSTESYYSAIRAVGILVENGCRVRISCTIHKRNLSHVPSMIELAENLGAEQLITSSLVDIGKARSSTLETIDHREEFTALYNAVRLSSQKQQLTRSTLLAETVNAIRSGIKFSYCGTGCCTCCIDSDGSIFPCINMMRENYCAGSITSSLDAITNIWESSPKLSQLRALDVNSMNNKCSGCAFRYFCGAYCRGETIESGAALTDPYVRCKSWKQGLIRIFDFLSETPDLYDFGQEVESPRVSWRLHLLRGWSHEHTKAVSQRVEGTSSTDGARSRGGV
ncbi:MAG: radical SAM protein, partial [Actinobacteria bacterium]|nr:radical SAM protein [Actinomycetota bacterium]